MAKSVSQIRGVITSDLNFASGTLLVEYDPGLDPRDDVVAAVRRAGHGIDPLDLRAQVEVAAFDLTDANCQDCAAEVRGALEGMPGVSAVMFEVGPRRLRVTYDPAEVTTDELGAALVGIGLSARLIGSRAEQRKPPAAGRPRQHRTEVAVVGGVVLIAAAWVLGRTALPDWVSVATYAAAIVVSGTVTWRRAVMSLRTKSIDMNVLMTIAVVGAAALGQWSEAATVIWLFALGGLLESRSLARTRRSIRDLMDLAPPTALVRREGETVEVAPADVRVGETLIVRPGERVALDGSVLVGSSAVDESPITGESMPVDKVAGDVVFAGSLATTGLLEVDVTAVASDTTLARIVYLVEEAQASKAPSQRLVDRFTRWYTPSVVALSVAVAIVPPVLGRVFDVSVGGFAEWFYRGLVVLVVSCPCALVISTPVAIVSAISRAARDGILVKGGAFVELVGGVRSIAFDKTGTLTKGRPEVSEVISLDSLPTDEVIAIAGALESNSTHPLGRALVAKAGESASRIHVSDFTDIPGIGVRGVIDGSTYEVGGARLLDMLAEDEKDKAMLAASRHEHAGRTVIALVRDGSPIAVMGLADALRPETPLVVSELYDMGIAHITMLTGDNDRTAEAIAASAGIRECRSRLLPQEKTQAIAELKGRYGIVAMVGDGINDAPALASADIGIAMGAAASDTALETADVALMSNDLRALPAFVRLGRRTVRIVKQNVGFSIAVKAVTLVLAVAGIATLWLAVFADMGVALLVIANSMRLLRREGRGAAVGNSTTEAA